MQTSFLVSFLTIAETGSFSKAARMLHISQPTLTQQIQSLEKELGFELFDRNHRTPVLLTPAGKSLVPELTGILRQLEDAFSRARGEANYQTVRMATIGYDSHVIPPPLYESLRREMPRLKLVTQLCEQSVLEPLDKGEAEMAIAGDCFTARADEFVFIRMGLTRYMCVMRPNHPLAGREEITVGEMVQYPVSFAVPEYSDSYNTNVDMIRKAFPALRELPRYAHIYHTSVLVSDTIYLSVRSAEPYFQGMACIPLAEPWVMPFGLLYPKDSGPTVRRIGELAREYAVTVSGQGD